MKQVIMASSPFDPLDKGRTRREASAGAESSRRSSRHADGEVTIC
jgi:hypothetical protein